MDAYLDPRIARTREHVLAVARQIMAERAGELSFPTLAVRAKVSKRTLYTHWGDIESVIIASIEPFALPDSAYVCLDVRGRLRLFLETCESQLEGGMAIAYASMIASSIHHVGSRRALAEVHERVRTAFESHVGKLTDPQFTVLVSSIIYGSMSSQQGSAELIDFLVDMGARMLEHNVSAA